MLRRPPFPISIDQLTAETLTDAMGSTVIAFRPERIGADRGMLGEIFLLDLEYADRAAGPDRVVAKFAALREGSLASARRGGAHERELRCFTELLPDTPVTAPRCHGAWYDADTAHFLLIQDAIETDTTVDQITGITKDDARLVLTEAARLHARWWRDPSLADLSWLPPLDGDRRIDNLTTLARAGWAPLCEMLGDDLTEAERALGAALPEQLEAALRSLATLPGTLIHSDLRADNLLFAPNRSSVTVVDWQGCGTGPPAFDIAYLLSQSLTVADRRAHERELLDFYRDELAAAGADLDGHDPLAGYGESMIYGLAIGCALPLISDPTEPRVRSLAAAVTRRSIEGLRDHDLLWEDT